MDIQQIFFSLLCLAVVVCAYRLYSRIYKSIKLGQDHTPVKAPGKRWKTMLLVAFGQHKMFKNWIPAIMHLFIYVAFLFTQIELIEILVDGFSGNHRFFANMLGPVYTVLINWIEILSLLALVGTIVFLWRRNLLKVPRFRKPEMRGWPELDANYILFGEILLIIGIFSMNGADAILQNIDPDHYPETGRLLISDNLGPALFSGFSTESLTGIERFGWWLHILVVFGFLLYLPVSKHLHIILAFPNTYFAPLTSRGEMENMPEIMNEVKSMMGLQPEAAADNGGDAIPMFGVRDIGDLKWKNLLDAYTCTECGRCTAACPANATGKVLSPRKVMMDIRDRADEVARAIQWDKSRLEAFDDGKSLYNYITDEELFACTACNACVEACPVMISPLEPILQMRRSRILNDSSGPQDWMPMFTSVENTGSVWQMPGERFDWAEQLEAES